MNRRSTQQRGPFHSKSFGMFLLLGVLLASAAGADWLITLDGRMLETQGSWSVVDGVIHYIDTQGQQRSMNVESVDLEASEETTAMKAGRPYVAKSSKAPSDSDEAAKDESAETDDGEAPIILYRTEWCGYCRKAEKLLKSLDANFVAKDIEKDSQAAAEFRAKAKGRGGVPLIDFDGDIVRGYSDRMIRQKIKEVEAKESR